MTPLDMKMWLAGAVVVVGIIAFLLLKKKKKQTYTLAVSLDAGISGSLGDCRADGLVGDGDGVTFSAGGNGVIHQAYAQTRVQLGIEFLRLCAHAYGRIDKRGL